MEKREKSCGAVIYQLNNNHILYLVEKMVGGHYALCKGHVEGSENETETALREIKEETNLDVIIDTSFRETTKYSPYPGCMKEVVYFIAKLKGGQLKVQLSEVTSAMWMPFEEAYEKLTYVSDKNILDKAHKYLIKKEFQ